MSDSGQTILASLRDDFVQAAGRWPGLHHAFVEFDVLKAHARDNWIQLFYPALVSCWVRPLVLGRGVLDFGMLPNSVQDSIVLTVYLGDGPGDLAGLRCFRALALTAARYVFADEVDVRPEPARYWNEYYWPARWLVTILDSGSKEPDPLLKVREHQIRLSEDGKRVLLDPGYAVDIPPGEAKGWNGQTRPWQALMEAATAGESSISVLETGVFRASAHAIERIMVGELVLPGLRIARKMPEFHPSTLAMALLLQEPDISPTELAERVGVRRGALYSSSPKWQGVRRTLIARDKARIPRGAKSKDGDIEAEYNPTDDDDE